MKRLYIITVLVALLSVSCNDWLDVLAGHGTERQRFVYHV